MTETLEKRPADAAVSQPSRLCAADAVPLLRPPPRLPAVHGLAGRASLPQAAQLPPLRLLAAAAREVPEVRRRPARSLPADRASSASPRRWPSDFPDARLALLSSDLVPGLTEMREMISGIEAARIDIIIGTQMVAKGHHFPGLATVGVVDGDLGLAHGADPRAARAHVPAFASGDGPRRARPASSAAASCRPICPIIR